MRAAGCHAGPGRCAIPHAPSLTDNRTPSEPDSRRAEDAMADSARSTTARAKFSGTDFAEGGAMHNPLRSEAEMFRVVVIVGLAAAPVIAVGAARPSRSTGRSCSALEVGIGIGLLWRGSRGSEPHTADGRRVRRRRSTGCSWSPTRPSPAGRCWTRSAAAARAARARSRRRAGAGVARGSSTSPTTSTARSPRPRERLGRSLAAMSAAGLRARGQVGDHHDPNVAIEDALREFAADEVVISTHPPGALEVARARGGRARRARDPAAGHARGRRPRGRGAPRPARRSARPRLATCRRCRAGTRPGPRGPRA